MKTLIKFAFPPVIFGSLIIGFIFEQDIRVYIENYSAVLHCCATIFFTGLIYSLITRSILVIAITTAATIATPWIREWLVYYWPYNPLF